MKPKKSESPELNMTEIKIGEMFDLEGELAILELHESYNIGGNNKHFILKLEIVGREAGVKFSEEEVKSKELPFVPFDRWDNTNRP